MSSILFFIDFCSVKSFKGCLIGGKEKELKKVAQLLRCQTFYKGRVPLHFDFHEESEASMGVLRK